MVINIGRNKENDVVIDNLKVSNYHAQMVIDEESKIFINDLQSENGTFVNGEIINEPTELKTKDEVIIANISFDWKKHIKNDNSDEKPVEIYAEKKEKNWLVIILISLLITVVLVSSLFIINEFNSDGATIEEIKKVEDSKDENNIKDEKTSEKNKDQKKEKPKKKIIKPVNDEISYDYSCLEDDKDMGTTNLINIASEIGEQVVDIGTEKVSLKEEIDFASESHNKIKEEYQFIYNNKQKKLNSILKKIEKEIKNPKGYNYKIYLIKDEAISSSLSK